MRVVGIRAEVEEPHEVVVQRRREWPDGEIRHLPSVPHSIDAHLERWTWSTTARGAAGDARGREDPDGRGHTHRAGVATASALRPGSAARLAARGRDRVRAPRGPWRP